MNGDSSATILRQSNIEGTLVVWREMLCEGPIQKTIDCDSFWKDRYKFFKDNFEVDKLEYYDKTIKELLQIDDFNGSTDIVMWFEFDLFCQINLLGLCSFLLERYRKDNRYYLVCPGTSTASQEHKFLAEFTATDFAQLYRNKIKLTRNDLLFADKCWEVFSSNVQDRLTQFDFNTNVKFNLLQGAINQHLLRFPTETGLGQIELKIIHLVGEKPCKPVDLVKKLLHWQRSETVYGFGDLQYFWYIKRLHPYLKSNKGVLELTSKATELLHYGN